MEETKSGRIARRVVGVNILKSEIVLWRSSERKVAGLILKWLFDALNLMNASRLVNNEVVHLYI